MPGRTGVSREGPTKQLPHLRSLAATKPRKLPIHPPNAVVPVNSSRHETSQSDGKASGL
jgi:hypothetical protein